MALSFAMCRGYKMRARQIGKILLTCIPAVAGSGGTFAGRIVVGSKSSTEGAGSPVKSSFSSNVRSPRRSSFFFCLPKSLSDRAGGATRRQPDRARTSLVNPASDGSHPCRADAPVQVLGVLWGQTPFSFWPTNRPEFLRFGAIPSPQPFRDFTQPCCNH